MLKIIGLPEDLFEGLDVKLPPPEIARRLHVVLDGLEPRFGARNPIVGQIKLTLSAELLLTGDYRGAFDNAEQADQALRNTEATETASLKNLITGDDAQSAISAVLAQSAMKLGGAAKASKETELAFEAYQRANDDETQRAMRLSAGVRYAADAALARLIAQREAALAHRKAVVEAIEKGFSKNGDAELDAVDREISFVDKDVAARFPRFSGMLAPSPIGLEETQGYIRPGEALVAFQVNDDSTIAWIVRHDGSDCVLLPVGRSRLETLARRIRRRRLARPRRSASVRPGRRPDVVYGGVRAGRRSPGRSQAHPARPRRSASRCAVPTAPAETADGAGRNGALSGRALAGAQV